MDRIRQWWKVSTRYIWSGGGMLWTLYGAFRLIQHDDLVLGWMAVFAGLPITVFPLTRVKCSHCGQLNPFEQVWNEVFLRLEFMCSQCGTKHDLPRWGKILMEIILMAWFMSFIAAVFDLLQVRLIIVGVDGLVFANALAMLIIRFSFIERADRAAG